MKIFLSISLFTLLLFTGCDSEFDLTSPMNGLTKLTSEEPLPEDIINDLQCIYPREDNNRLYPPGSDSIFIPVNIPSVMSPQLRVSNVIDGIIGGVLTINFEYYVTELNVIKINASLIFLPGSFDGSKEISMVMDNTIGTISFYPHMVFDIPAQLNLVYTGINLSEVNTNSIDFIFQNDDGLTEQVNYDAIKVLPEVGYLELINASLEHFSRYGWTR